MRKKTHKQQRKLSTDTLLKTSKKDIELTEKELGQVTGGKGSAQTQKYMEIKNQDIMISSY